MDPLFVLVPIAGMATGGVFMVVIYKLIAKWMDHRHLRERQGLPALSEEELQDLRHDLVALRDLPERVAELEERLDFAERLLARSRDGAGELGAGQGG